jgi:hypothetical protein
MSSYQLAAVLLLVILLGWFLSSSSEGATWILNKKVVPKPEIQGVTTKKDIPKPTIIRYHPSQLAYPTFEAAHKHRLRSTVKDSTGMALSDYALENNLINQHRS